jgi:hypothetical protein
MSNKTIGNGLLLVGVALVILSALGFFAFRKWQTRRAQIAVWDLVSTLQKQIQAPGVRKLGHYWTDDVATLHSLGLITKEAAEADARPKSRPLGGPRPYHGYYMVAMDSGPGNEPPYKPVSLTDGKVHQETFGICVFPAHRTGPDYPVYLVCPWGRYRKASESNQPILRWPSQVEMGKDWGIVD